MTGKVVFALTHPLLRVAVPALLGIGIAPGAIAGTCTVPGSHPSIQAAVDDPGCASIELSNQSYSELLDIGRSLTLLGPPGGNAQVVGQVSLSGTATEVVLSDFGVESGCGTGALRVLGGAQMTGSGLQVVYDPDTPCLAGFIFSDGFED